MLRLHRTTVSNSRCLRV